VTDRQVSSWYGRLPERSVPVVTGFIGGTADGSTTTLGRGGSDYSASLIATALRAERLERWTDIDGVYTSDPKVDPTAHKLERIVMADALAWNRTGKMGIHKKTLEPLLEASIPMYVRSIDTPEVPGTAILPRRHRLAVAC
jgi:aspartate kinase